MAIDPVEEEVASIWRRRVAWSRAADALKARLERARTAALALAVLGAVLETAAATLPLGWLRPWSAGVGAAALAAGTFLTARLVTAEAVRAWTRARSVSEGIKAEVYAFRAGAAPYAGPGAPRALAAQVHAIEDGARDLERHVAEIAVAVADARPPPALAPDDYVAQRVVRQADEHYRRKARALAGRLRALRGIELGLGLAATIAGAAAAAAYGGGAPPPAGSTGGAMGAWVAVLTTVGGAIAAHVAAARHDFLVMSYHATARRLDALVEAWRADGAPTDAPRWSDFVHGCERAISIENESWLAKWAEQAPERRDPG